MATVTSYTVAKMKEILDQTVKFLSIDATGNLIATRNDNSEVNLGNVKGGQGDRGIQGPPGTTPAILANVSQTAGGTLTPGESSSTFKISNVDLSSGRWYGIHHVGDLSTSLDGAHALFITVNGAQLQCIYRKAVGDPTATRESNSFLHIWKPPASLTAPLIGVANSSGSAGPIVYNNVVGEPRTFTLLDLGPATF